jgi:hypothetical protein
MAVFDDPPQVVRIHDTNPDPVPPMHVFGVVYAGGKMGSSPNPV